MHLLSSQPPEDSVAMLAMMLLSWLLCGPSWLRNPTKGLEKNRAQNQTVPVMTVTR
jgi:hypothetical protein